MSITSRSFSHVISAWFLAACLNLLALPVHAQSAASYLEELRQLAQQQGLRADSLAAPRAMNVAIPSGFGLSHGSVGLGAAITNMRERVIKDPDGSGAISLGFGNAQTAVGVELTLGLVSTKLPWRREGSESVLGEDGNLSIKLFREFHHTDSGRVSALAIGVGNAIAWGDPQNVPANYFIAGSTTFFVPWLGDTTRPGMATLGAGTAVKNQERDPGVFAGIGLGITSWAAAGVSWSGDEVIAGMTFFPKISNTVDLQIGLSYADVTRRVSDGRFNVNVSLVFNDLY